MKRFIEVILNEGNQQKHFGQKNRPAPFVCKTFIATRGF